MHLSNQKLNEEAGSITAFLPCRKGSVRVPNKNIKPFANYSHGLVEIKLRQLLACNEIDKVVLSTNDHQIIDYVESIKNQKIQLHVRDDDLGSSSTSTDDLIGHASQLVDSGSILWTHVTSPFVSTTHYSKIIAAYFDCLKRGYDSLMTVTALKAFLWNEKGALNYDRRKEKWPRTQTLDPVYEVNSAVFLASTEIYQKHIDRIGTQPLLYSLDSLVALDIDWENDFLLAESLLSNKLMSV